MSIEPLARYQVGDTVVIYQIEPETGRVGLLLCPAGLEGRMVEPRLTLAGSPEWGSTIGDAPPGRQIDPLVQLKVLGDPYPAAFSQGRTMRNGLSTRSLRYESQEVRAEGQDTTIVTTLARPADLSTATAGAVGAYACEHRLAWRAGEPGFRITTVFHNRSPQPLTLEMLSSFSLGGITPFDAGDAPGRLVSHRLRSGWSAEGRLETRALEDLHLERSWLGGAAFVERFGQVGSMPVRGFFPFVAVEDAAAGATWGAQLAWAGSWQMETYRLHDAVALSGGLADREFGHWMKTVAPGGSFETPPAIVATAAGGVDALCARLTAMGTHAADQGPAVEADLPFVCNEWCTTWGKPTHESTVALARRLAGTAVRYLVIDAGWYRSGQGWGDSHGDWEATREAFPGGLAATAAAIRDCGLIPGLWFEMETCGPGSKAYAQVDHLLRRDGYPIQSGGRRFWDLRDPWAVDYLAERVIGQLRAGGFGYLKVDYNETIGIGADARLGTAATGAGQNSPAAAGSLGEGLREHIEGVYAFFRLIRRELPDLVIENCSSGGHRLEPSMLALTAMSSFSDAHEVAEIPIIAANVQRALLPRQSQIWAVLRRADSPRRLVYSLAAGFLGRLCISGDIAELDAGQWAVFERAQALYRQAWPVIKYGTSYRYGPDMASYRHPTGWQAVLRVGHDRGIEAGARPKGGRAALAVVHTFGQPLPDHLEIPLPPGAWELTGRFDAGEGSGPAIQDGKLVCQVAGEFTGQVVYLSST